MKKSSAKVWDPANMPSQLINRLARRLAALGETQLRPLAFGMAQLPVLALLKDGRSMSPGELARAIRVEQPSMTQMLARMDRDGLIHRAADPTDARRSVVSLTQTALDRLPQGREVLLALNERVLEGFSADDVATLTRLLHRLHENLDRLPSGDRAD